MKKFIIMLLGVVVMQNAISQNTLNLAGLSSSVPAAPSYSLRLLSSSYAGYAIRVRRSNDNTTMDIGFVSGSLDTAALKTFVGSNSGYVSIWYDQSGNGKNATQASNSNQPCIMLSGVIYRQNSVPTVYFNGSNTLSTVAYTNGYPNAFTLAICGGIKNNTGYSTFGNKTNNNLPGPWDYYNGSFLISNGAGAYSYTLSTPISSSVGFAQWTFQSNASSASAFLNGAANGSGTPSICSDATYATPIILGSRTDGVTTLDGWISEFVTFPSLLSTTDRQIIEANQTNYYKSFAITSQPSTTTQSVGVGGAVTALTVTAWGSNLSYQWYSNAANSNSGGTLLSGATSSSYTPSSSTTGTLYYYVVVTSSAGNITSNVSGAVSVRLSPTITGFNNLTKTLFDGSFTLIAPTSNSTGAFSYTSSNTSVASISGSNVTIVSPGTTTITATQAADATYSTSTVTATLTVNSVSVITKNGQITTTNNSYVNSNGAIGTASSVNLKGQSVAAKSSGDGLSASTAASSAYAIKQAYPNSTDGYYWIQNNNINGGSPFQIYADMTTDGGGWTLIMCNANNGGWSYTNAIALNTTSPSINSNYSIIGWADYIKRSASGFQYMIDANTSRSNGAIWTANGSYSFVNGNNTQTNITINTKFGTWTYDDGGIEQIMPWYSNCSGYITTSNLCSGGSWWGTLISQSGWGPAPWIAGGCGVEGCQQNPGVIWYWVR